MISLKEVLQELGKKDKAILQLSFSSYEQFQAYALSAKRLDLPLLLGLSEGGANFLGLKTPLIWRDYWRKQGALVYLNLDHGKDLSLLKKAIDLGFDMIHFDASETPFEKAIEISALLTKKARKKGVLVEGEIDKIKGKSGRHNNVKIKDADLTKYENAFKFLKKSKVDLFAPFVGNIHGIAPRQPSLRFSLISALSDLPCFLVLHGGSGYNIKDLKRAVDSGIRKINIGTALRLVWVKEINRSLEKGEFKPYKIFSRAQEQLIKKTEKYLLALTG